MESGCNVPCTYPLRAIRLLAGGISICKQNTPRIAGEFPLPCGQCLECKLERTRQWAVRIMHEAQLHQSNWFITLTYDQEHLPRSLDHLHFQKFVRSLRKVHGSLRYFMCGEYGDQLGRPHFHAIIFGLEITDLVHFSGSPGQELYTSKNISDRWQRGFVTLGRVNFQTASYCASYCTKKITGERAKAHYERLDPETGEIYDLKPEYSRMSLKPGVAANWIKKFGSDVYNYDHVIVNGREQKPPRYYDNKLQLSNPQLHLTNKQKRITQALISTKDSTPQKRKARQAITTARLKLRSRTL